MGKRRVRRASLAWGVSPRLASLIEHQGGRCYYCTREMVSRHETLAPSIDHKTPICMGGAGGVPNIVAACRECNGLKGPLDAETFIAVRLDRARLYAALAEAHAKLRAFDDANRPEVGMPRGGWEYLD